MIPCNDAVEYQCFGGPSCLSPHPGVTTQKTKTL